MEIRINFLTTLYNEGNYRMYYPDSFDKQDNENVQNKRGIYTNLVIKY